MPPPVLLYTSRGCPDCAALRSYLRQHAVAFEERDLAAPGVSDEAKTRYGVRIAPITVIGDRVLYGTFDIQKPQLDALLPEWPRLKFSSS